MSLSYFTNSWIITFKQSFRRAGARFGFYDYRFWIWFDVFLACQSMSVYHRILPCWTNYALIFSKISSKKSKGFVVICIETYSLVTLKEMFCLNL